MSPLVLGIIVGVVILAGGSALVISLSNKYIDTEKAPKKENKKNK